jgi:hypothetical protein
MTQISSYARRKCTALAALALITTASAALAADKPEVYNGTATMKTAAGATATAPVVVSISRWTTDAERDKAVAALKSGGMAAFHKEIAALPEAGFLQVGDKKTPLRFARSLAAGDGHVVSVATAEPVMYVGAGMPGAKPIDKDAHDVAVVIFHADAAGKADVGDFAPAATVSFDANGALLVKDYAAEAVRLRDIVKK